MGKGKGGISRAQLFLRNWGFDNIDLCCQSLFPSHVNTPPCEIGLNHDYKYEKVWSRKNWTQLVFSRVAPCNFNCFAHFEIGQKQSRPFWSFQKLDNLIRSYGLNLATNYNWTKFIFSRVTPCNFIQLSFLIFEYLDNLKKSHGPEHRTL